MMTVEDAATNRCEERAVVCVKALEDLHADPI